MKLIRTEDAVGQVLCHDITQIIPGQFKGARFRKGHIVQPEDIPVLLSIGKENLYVWEKRPGILHEDEEFTPRVLLQAQRVVLTGQEIYYYDNCRAGSITHAEGLSTRRVQDRLRIYDSLAEIYRTVTPRALRRRLQDDLSWKYLDCAARFDCRTLPGYRPQRLRMLQFACTPRRRAKAALFALSPELFRRVMNH